MNLNHEIPDDFEHGASGGIGFADGHKTLVEQFHHRDDLDEKFASEFPQYNEGERADVLAFFEENGGGGRFGAHKVDQIRAEAMREVNIFFARVFSVMIRMMERQPDDPKFLRMTPKAVAMTVGFTDEAGAKTQVDLARVCGLGKLFGNNGKAAVGKMIKVFCKEKLNLPPVPGGRKSDACQEMTDSRNEQLKK